MEKGQDSKTGLPASAPSVDSYPITQISNDESCPDQHTMAATQRSSIKRNNSYSFKNLQSNDPIHLSAYENQVLERQLSMPSIKVSYMMLYRYATKIDILTLIISSICAMASGVVLPLMTIVFGQLGGTFQDFFSGSIPDSHFSDRLSQLTLYFVYLGIGQLIAVYIAFAGFTYTGEHVTQKLREKYLEAILGQNIAVFDHLGAGEVTTTITANMDQVMGGISEKVALTLTAATTFVAALIVGFVKNWRLSLVLLSIVFAVVFIMGGCSVFIVKYTKRSLDAYSPGAVLAEEVLTSVRTVTAFNGQTKLAKKFEESLLKTMHWGFRTKVSVGCMIASMMLISYLEYGLSFWEGSRLMVAGYGNLADTLTVLFALLMGAVSVAHAAPHIQSFAAAIAAAANIFKIIDRRMPEHTESQSGIPLEVQGSLEFQEVKHIYPSRPEVIVIQDFNLVIPAGKITALVGASGSGKSTIVGLIENFYPNVGGKIFLDGHDIQGLDTKWLRRQISLVSQEPVLFKCSIRRNIEHGLIGTNLDAVEPEKKSELVVQAAKMANAHDFISCLPNGYETVAGDRGVLLSGGQKQRIAIARAIISNPKILLLDEATSALDSQSEGIVQAALDVAAQGRTTIVIAHRLSTIKGADNIVVLSKGRVVEQGTHDQLLLQKGAYHDLIEAQNLNSGEDTYGSNPATDSKSRAREIQINHGLDNPILKDGYKPSLSTANSNTTQGAPIEHEDTLWEMAKVIASFNRQESGIMILGLLCSILAGLAMPVQGIIFAKCIVALSLPPTHYAQLRIDIDFWSLMFLIVAILVFIVSSSHGIAFAYCSEHLIYRARNKTFRSILRQDIAYFDDGVNSAGALTSLISKGTNDLAGISGAILGAILQLITTVIASIAISCVIGWKLGLVCSATIPVLLLCGFLRFWVLARFQTRSEKAYQASAALACEAVSAISTIASLTREEDVWNQYHCMLETQLQRSMGSVLKTSFLYAASQSFSLFCMALGFWYGGTLILAGEYDMFQFFVCFSSVIFSAQSAGALFSFAPDMAKSKDAAQQLKSIWDRTPDIDSSSEDGELTGELQGSVEFRDVHFSYPTRTEQPVLRGLNLKAESGQFIALVGESGCGKSTVVSLLERFYNPTSGGIFVDGRDISTLNVKEYRSRLALVSQEPVLYRGTIRENILLGIEDQSDTEEAIVEACKKANIYDFIMSLSDGLSTTTGSKGVLLSGGQKQRVAIARALICNPQILLLDEATSALDSESEKVVQEALDKAARGRTTIAVAHRLSTIQNADCIYVIEGGLVVEAGSHGELMGRRGRYYRMAMLQGLLAGNSE